MGLAAVEKPNWTAIVASVAGSLAAWQEFVGLAQKLDRYSGAAASLGNILMWWQALPEVDQANMRNIDHLVEITENLVNQEHAAWVSDAQKSLNMKKKQPDGSQQGDKTGASADGGKS